MIIGEDKLEQEVMRDGILLYLEQLNLKLMRSAIESKIDKKRFNKALDIAKKFNLDILDWETERREVKS
jgi:hypothetical protein|tara:strand:- start:1419 stop:1625 length:207 start_codon:yes stop_codon:yes gene_type:complete